MNNLSLPINNISYTVERPVIYDIVRQLMDVTEISSKTPIKYMGEEARSLQPDSAIDSPLVFNNNWPYTERVEVEISEEYDPDRILSTSVLNPDNYPIFRDTDLDLLMRPIYGVTNVVITFKYRASDRNAANTWRNNIKTRTSMGRDIILHNIQYSYSIPEVYIAILKEVHRLREKQCGYDDTFEEYLQNHICSRTSTVSNMNGEEFNYVISEKQSRIQGWFEFAGVPDKPEKVEDGSAYITTFTYKFTYDKPINLNIIYPYVIHNQLLSKKYRELAKLETLKTKNNIYSLSSLSFTKFEDGNEILEAYGNRGLDIPSFDYTFIPNSILPGSGRIFTALCNISENDKKSLLNLNDLGLFNLNKQILDFIKHDKDNLLANYKSIFNISLYENNNLKNSNILELDNDLNLKSKIDLNLRKTYRIRLSVIVNLDMLPDLIISNIRSYVVNNMKFGVILVNAINSILKDRGNDHDISKSYLDYSDLIKIGILNSPINPSSNLDVVNVGNVEIPTEINDQVVINSIVEIVNNTIDINRGIYNNNRISTNLSQCMFIITERNE